jgi:hypothetical protein
VREFWHLTGLHAPDVKTESTYPPARLVRVFLLVIAAALMVMCLVLVLRNRFGQADVLLAP